MARDEGWTALEIEDTSDCPECERRRREFWELAVSVKLKTIGRAWCRECGQEYEVMTETDEYEEQP